MVETDFEVGSGLAHVIAHEQRLWLARQHQMLTTQMRFAVLTVDLVDLIVGPADLMTDLARLVAVLQVMFRPFGSPQQESCLAL